MGGVINEDGGIRPDGAPVGRDTTFDSLTLPPTFGESSNDNEASRGSSARFSDDIATVARILFPGQLEARHAVKMAGVFALARQGVGHWIDGVCGDADFLKEYGGALADLKGVSLARLKSFVRTHAAEVEKLSEFVRTPGSIGTANLELAHFVIAASLLHTERTIVRGGATENLTAEVTLALDLARRVEPALLAEWKGVVRHMLRHGIDELVGQSKQELTPEIRAWQYAHPCTFFLPMFCVADTPKTYIADVLEGSRLLANTGVLAAFVEEASHLGSEEAANFFGRTVAKVGEIVTKISKDRSSATATLGALVEQLPVADRLALIEVLAVDPRATELGRRLESYGILKKDAGYASWLILHRERVVELDGKSGSFADRLVELAENRPGIRPGLVALVGWSDRFVEADLIGGALTLIKSSLDPSKVKQRIDAAGEALQSGSSADEAQAILERGAIGKPIAPLPLSKTPPIVVTPIRTILYERLAATPELQEWVLDTFNRSDEPTEISRCLRRVAAKSPAVTPRLVAFLKEFGTESGCRQFLASPSGFERLADFLSHGRHEEIREFKRWLRGETVEEPMALRTLHGFGKSPSPAVVAADAEDRDKSNPHRDHIFIPLGAYRRLVVIGGEYSPPKRTAIEEAAGEMSVVFFSPDDNSRSIRQTLIRGDLVVINSEKISHSTSERVVAQCRAQDIAWIRVAHSGYKVVADIAARIRG